MQPSNRRHALFLAVATCATAIGLASASAQLIPNAPPGVGSAGMPRGGAQSRDNAGQAPAAPPDAIPGAKARQPVAPATKSANDMNPTDALFDAIDRGDIAAARDALNRGADMNGVNVLGMTPMELSVDLGRNDISFLLLSMRGADSGQGSRASGRGGQPSVSDKPAPVIARTSAGGKKSAANGKATAAPVTFAADKPTALPKLWSNDGGAPQPNAGFLGFGSRQAAN
jgi:hypothetical protein